MLQLSATRRGVGIVIAREHIALLPA